MCPEGARRRFEISPATHTLPTPPSSAARTRAASWVTVRMRGAGSARSIARAYISPFAARDEGLEDLPALEQLERVVELRVGAELALLDVGRHALGWGLPGGAGLAVLAFLLLALPAAQVARQVRLAQQRAVAAFVALGKDGRLLHHDVGHDAGRLDRAAARREVARGRQAQRRAVVERQDGLHRALAEGLRAEDEGALVVLERARDDLRGAGAPAVHQHDHREVGPRAGLVREVLLFLVLEPAVGVDDEARVEEEVGHLDRLGEEAARIVAQVEDQALEPARLLVEALERPLEVVVGALLELRHAHVAVALVEHLRLDALDLDDLARQRDVEELGHVLALQGERHLGLLRAAHLLDRVHQRQVLGELALDLQDLIAGLDPGAVGGRVLDGRDDGQDAVAVRDLDAEAAEAALGVDLELLVEVRRQVGAVRVEGGKHPVDGALDQLLGLDLADVVLLDDGEDVGEGLEPLVGLLGHGVDLLDPSPAREEHGQEHGQADGSDPRFPSLTDHPLYPVDAMVRVRAPREKQEHVYRSAAAGARPKRTGGSP